MPKALTLDPSDTRRPGRLQFRDIPINAYQTPIGEELGRIGPDGLIRILRDMILIREFESMLDCLKRGSQYQGIRYNHLGPAHLAIGQEAVAVGQAFTLGPGDHIFGSHRSHAEIIAKGLSSISHADDVLLQRIMEAYLGGAILRVVESHLASQDCQTQAIQFLLYGLLAEIFGRRTGFNRGMGGSMHAFFPPFGIYPNNAIVGASAGIAAGAALFKKLTRAPGIAIANVGDGATGCGLVWEAMNFSTMGQFRTLWEEQYRGGLPIVFCFVDNFYAMGGQTAGETMGYEHLSRIGGGLNPESMHAETIDGNNPLAVVDAIRRKRRTIENGQGPTLLDIHCYRQSGHSASDANAYRSREEIEAWRAVDPIREYGKCLQEVGVIDSAGVENLSEWARARVTEICRLAVDVEISPRLDVNGDPDAIANLMFSGAERDLSISAASDLRVPLQQSSRAQQLSKLARSGIDRDGNRIPAGKAITIRDALFEAIAHRMTHDPLLIAYGEENRDWGGAFAVYRGLAEILPYHRLFNAPISEAAIIATAVGYALEGGRALVELMYADFMGRAGDELFNQLAKWQAMSGGTLQMPVVVRVSVGNKYGAQHSQEWSALVAHIPGLRVVFPATPYDAKGLMSSALAGSDPVIFIESQRLYDTVELFHEEGVPRGDYRLPIGEPDIKRTGKDITILTIGATLYRAIEAADRLASDFGIQAEVIDARSLVPFNYEPVLASIRKTRRILMTSDACERGSHLATLAANVQEFAFDELDAPVAVVGARNWIAPPAEMEEMYLPQVEDLLEAIHTRLLPLDGYLPRIHQNLERRIKQARRGV